MSLETNLTVFAQAVGADIKQVNGALAGAAIRTRTATNEAAPTAANWQPRPAGYAFVIAVGAAPAPADANPGDLHVQAVMQAGAPPAGETTTFSNNQSGWPSPWITGVLPAGGSINTTGGRGVLTTAAATGNYSSNDAAAVRHQTQVADFTIVYTFRRVNDVYARFVLRSSTPNLDPQHGIVVGTYGTTLAIAESVNWNYTTLGTVAKTWTAGVDYKVRIAAAGQTVQAKAWAASGSEPAGWDVTGTAVKTAAGHLGFAVHPAATAAAYTASYDDITFAGG